MFKNTVLKTHLGLSMFIFYQLSRPTDFLCLLPEGYESTQVVFELKITAVGIANNGKNGKSVRDNSELTAEVRFQLV